MLEQPSREARDAFVQVDFRFPIELSLSQRNIEGAAQPVRRHFSSIRVLANFELQIG